MNICYYYYYYPKIDVIKNNYFGVFRDGRTSFFIKIKPAIANWAVQLLKITSL